MAQPEDITNSLRMRETGATVAPADVSEALQPYGLTKDVSKGKSDQQLHDLAVQSVIKWWKKQKADQQAAQAAAAQAAHPAPARSGSSGGSGGGGSAGSSGSSGSGGPSLPDTAMGTGGGPSGTLPHIVSPAQRQAQQIADLQAQQRQMAAAEAKAQAPALLAAAGFGYATPPAYAMTSVSNLKAWIARAKKQQADALARQNQNRGMTAPVTQSKPAPAPVKPASVVTRYQTANRGLR